MQVIGCAGSSKQELAMHCAARARSTAVARDVFWASQAKSSLVIMVAGTERAGPEAEGEMRQ